MMADWETVTENDLPVAFFTRIKEFAIEIWCDSDGRWWVKWSLGDVLSGQSSIERTRDVSKVRKEGLYIFRDWLAKWIFEVNKELPPPRRETHSLSEVGSAFNDFLPRCDNCHKQIGENVVGRMAFAGKRFCSAKCAEEYSE